MLDEGGGFTGPLDIAVDNGVVTQVGRDLRSDAQSYDFRGLWVMPGMVDCHLHAIATSLDTMEMLRTPLSERVLDAAGILRRSLEAGVTFARDAGGIDAGVRNAVQRGHVPGPGLQVAVGALSQTGGHFDGFLAGPAVPLTTGYQVPDYPGRPPLVVDGPDEVRHAVRLLLRAGADWIKLCTTGGIMSGTGAAPQFTGDEIMTAVSEARRRGKPAMVHCFGGEGLRHSLEAGVRSIDHGLLLTEEDARLMAAGGCWLVPTLTILSDTAVAIADAQQLGAISGRRQQRRLGAETGVGDAGDLAQVGAMLLAADEIRAEGDLHPSGLSYLDRLAEARLQLANAGRGGG